jgi:hypothetical protein
MVKPNLQPNPKLILSNDTEESKEMFTDYHFRIYKISKNHYTGKISTKDELRAQTLEHCIDIVTHLEQVKDTGQETLFYLFTEYAHVDEGKFLTLYLYIPEEKILLTKTKGKKKSTKAKA